MSRSGGEWTPLQPPSSSAFAAGSGNEMKAFVTNLLGPENLSSASTAARSRFSDLYQQTRTGDWSLRLLGLLSGVALIVASLLEVIVHFFTLHWIRLLIDLFLLATGLVLLVLESRQLNLPEPVLSNLYAHALFLKFVWGRGLLLVVAGVLQMGQGGGLVAWIVGAFVLLAGVVHVIVGRSAARKLAQLRAAMSEQTLHGKFHEANVSGTGALSTEEFASLSASLGVPLGRGEAEAAFLHVSQDSTAIAFDRFRSWWSTSGGGGLNAVV
jgi:COPI associated protein